MSTIYLIFMATGGHSLYLLMKIIHINRKIQNNLGVSILSNQTMTIVGICLVIVLLSGYGIILKSWNTSIDNFQLLYYDLILMSNLALIAKYKKILNGLERLTEIKK